jgi:3-oxoacyl-[acyl-carrier-protein] synthase-3
MNLRRAVLAGTGIATPPRVVTNHEIARVMDTSDEWIVERSGVRERRFVERGVASSDLGAEAARAAIADAGLNAGEIDYIVCATMTPDSYFPGCGTLIQQKLGLAPLPALDIRQQCAGYAYGLQLVDALIRSGIARCVLLVGCDVHTSLMPFSEATWAVLEGRAAGPPPAADVAWNSRFRHMVVLFGDAAGAMIFRAEEGSGERGILATALYGDGGQKGILFVPGAGSARRPWVTPEQIAAGETVPIMEGKQVFKLAVTKMPEVTQQVLADAGYSLADLDLLVMHQANLRINEFAQKALGLPDAKVHNNIQKAPRGALVAFTALGAGLHWGSVLLRV